MRNSWLLILIVHLSCLQYATAQAPIDAGTFIPKITMPSPEAFSFTRYGDIPVGLFTGTMNYSIPLFQVQSGKISVPVSLDYASNGVKVDAVSGRTGMDWNLKVGGVITRNILGKPDEQAALMAPGNTDSSSWEFFYYMKAVADQNANTQPDEFTYSFMGQSGKFYFDYAGNLKELSPSGFKITTDAYYSDFKVFTPDGTQYTFYGAEQTYNYSLYGDNDYLNTSNGGRTAWYLGKIKNIYGDSIELNYAWVNIEPISYLSGISQTYKGGPTGGFDAPYIKSGSCAGGIGELWWTTGSYFGYCPVGVGANTDISITTMKVVKLTEVVSKQGIMKFYYSSREDLPGEEKLDSIDLFSRLENKRIKTIALEYIYSQASSTYNVPEMYTPPNIGELQNAYPYLKKRLFLDKVKFFDATKSDYQFYKFDYDGLNELPPRLSFSQDFFGYFNGKENSAFLPDNTIYNNLVAVNGHESRRKVDSAFTRKGLLKRITYPTGGYSDILYENNLLGAARGVRVVFDTVSIKINYTSSAFVEYSNTFSCNSPYKLIVSAEWITPPDPNGPQLDPNALVSIENASTNDCIVCNINVNAGESYEYTTNLHMMGWLQTYRLKIWTGNPNVRAKAEFIHYSYAVDSNVNVVTAGARVIALKNYSAVNNLTNVKRFNYDGPDGLSSGGSINDFYDGRDFSYIQRTICSPGSGNPDEGYYGTNWILSSHGSLARYENDYAAVNYKYVTETYDSSGIGGSVTTQFQRGTITLASTFACSPPLEVWHHSPFLIPNASYSNTDYLNGKELKKTYYKKVNGNSKKVKEIVNHYSTDPRLYNVDSFYVIRRVYFRNSYSNSWKYFADYDINEYKRISAWVHIDSTIQKDFDDGDHELKIKTAYTYGNQTHLQPTEVQRTTSVGDISKTITQYADDLRLLDLNNTVLNNMCSQNMTNIPLVSKTYLNNNLLSTSQIEYNASLLPGTIKTSTKNAALEVEVEYTKYDELGNPQEFKVREQASAIITDTAIGSMIAGCRNALFDQIAYTSFETGSWGGWTMNPGSTIFDNGAPLTGKKVFSGVILKTVPTGNYTVGVWSIANTWINGQLLTQTPTKTLGQWRYFEVELNNVSNIEVSANTMDEVRLYPKGAQMTTYTYDPLIGLTSQCDVNNRITYYEYDGFGRLKTVRDENKNVLKTFDYQFQKPYNQ